MTWKTLCAFVVSWFCSTNITLLAQSIGTATKAQTSPTTIRNPEAVSILQKYLAQYQPALATIVDSSAQGSCTQASSPALPFTWTVAGSSYRYQNIYGSDASVLVKGPRGTFKQVSANIPATPLRRSFGTAVYPVQNPFLLLENALIDPSTAVTGPQNVSSRGREVLRIKVNYGRDTTLGPAQPVLLYFDREQETLLWIDYRHPDEVNPNASAPVHVEYGAPTLQNGIPGPSSFTLTDAIGAATLCTITSWSFNTSPPASTFLPGGTQ